MCPPIHNRHVLVLATVLLSINKETKIFYFYEKFERFCRWQRTWHFMESNQEYTRPNQIKTNEMRCELHLWANEWEYFMIMTIGHADHYSNVVGFVGPRFGPLFWPATFCVPSSWWCHQFRFTTFAQLFVSTHSWLKCAHFSSCHPI